MNHDGSGGGGLIGTILGVSLVVAGVGSVSAESPAPTVHWGGLSHPDQSDLLDTGFTANRFTEFDGRGKRFNAMDETMGLNFATVSWTSPRSPSERPATGPTS